MYKYFYIVLSFLLLSGCSMVDRSTHDKYNDIPQTNIIMDTENITGVSPSEVFTMHILKDGEPVDDADITLTMWAAKDAEVWSEEYDVSHEGDGAYTAELNIPREGLYLIKAYVKDDTIDALPSKYFTVGSLDMFEEVFIQEFSNDDSMQTHSHH